MSKKTEHRFYLKTSTNSKGESSIFLLNSYYGNQFKYGIGLSILPELWDKENNAPISREERKFIKEIEDQGYPARGRIKEVKKRISKITDLLDEYEHSKNILKQNLDFKELRELLDTEIKKVKNVSNKDSEGKIIYVLDYINNFISGIESGRITIAFGKRQGQRYSEGTIKNYNGFKVQFEAFQKSTGMKYKWEDVTLKFYKRFIAYFNEKDYSKNTIGRHIKNLKVIMDAARVDGHHNNMAYREKGFQTLRTTTTEVFLTEEEIQKLYDLDLSKKPRLERIRDVFLIGCYTGQRFSDVIRIGPRNIKNGDIELIQQKTKEKAIIPIVPELREILKKYKGKVPTVYEQKVNFEIKEICKDIGFAEETQVTSIRGGKVLDEWIPKYKMVKTHTGRRSAITNMYLKGFDIITIMSISGHKKEAELLNYIRATPKQKAERLKAQREMYEFMRQHKQNNS